MKNSGDPAPEEMVPAPRLERLCGNTEGVLVAGRTSRVRAAGNISAFAFSFLPMKTHHRCVSSRSPGLAASTQPLSAAVYCLVFYSGVMGLG